MAKKYNLDNPLIRFMNHVADIICLSILWVIGCIPILTIGTSTTALYYAAMKSIRGEGSDSKNFFKSYQENLKQSVQVELIILLSAFLLYVGIRTASNMNGNFATILYALSAILLFLCIIVISYLFPLLSRFNQAIPVLFRNAFLISFSNFPCTVAVIILNLMPLVAFLIWPAGFMRLLLLMLFFAPGLIARLNSAMLMRVFIQYEPQNKSEDAESAHD